MNQQTLTALILFGASLIFPPAGAYAEDLTFCESNCHKFKVFNDSSVVVTKVKVEQHAGANNCPKVEQVHTGNLLEFESFLVYADPNCPYYVKYVTTDGCAGDKDGRISLQDFKDERTLFYLNGACGTLHVTNEKPRRAMDL